MHDLLRAYARAASPRSQDSEPGDVSGRGADQPVRLLPRRRRQRDGRPGPGRTALPAPPRPPIGTPVPGAGHPRPRRAPGSTPNAPSWSRSPRTPPPTAAPASHHPAGRHPVPLPGDGRPLRRRRDRARPRQPRRPPARRPRRRGDRADQPRHHQLAAGPLPAGGRLPPAGRWRRRSRSATAGGEAIALANLGIVYERQGRYERGGATASGRPWPLFREAGDRTGEARALANLGSVAARQGQYEQAVGWYQQALALLQGDRRPDRRGQRAARPRRRLPAAGPGSSRPSTATSRRWPCSAETGDRTGEAEARNGVGEILLATGRPDEARVDYTAALALASQIGDAYEQARAHDGLGAALHAGGDDGLARHHRSRALELYSALGAPEADAIRAELDQPSLTGQQELAGA